jgi:ribosomal protein S18 acetylase RimI-like enzyme
MAAYLVPSSMTDMTVVACARYADYVLVLDNGLGYLMLEDNQITLLAIASEARGQGYAKVLVDMARRLVIGRPVIVLAINEDVAAKVYEPLGFRIRKGLWMEAPTIQYTELESPEAPTGRCTL